MIITTQRYGQLLVKGIKNFRGIYFSDIVEGLYQDSVWRFLSGAKLGSKVIGEKAKQDIAYAKQGYYERIS
jgi:hypothetical protein